MRWHHRMAFLSIGLALVHGTLGILGEFGSGGPRIAGYSEEARNYSGRRMGNRFLIPIAAVVIRMGEILSILICR